MSESQQTPSDAQTLTTPTRRGLRALPFLILTVGAIALILWLTWDADTLPLLRRADPTFLLLLIPIWAVNLSSDGLCLWSLARGTGARVSFVTSIKAASLRILFNILTPFNFGGQPFMIYFLSQQGMPTGKASSVVATKLMSLSIFTMLGAGIAHAALGHDEIPNVALNRAFLLATVLCLSLTVVLLLALLRPHPLIMLISRIRRWFFRKHAYRPHRHLTYRAVRAITETRHSFRAYFAHHPGWFALAMLFSLIMYATDVLIIYGAIRAIGVDLPFGRGIVLAAMFELFIAFLPTPGAAGLGEGVFVLLFSVTGYVERSVIGIAVVVWRLFYHTLSALIGAWVVAHHGASLFSQSNQADDT